MPRFRVVEIIFSVYSTTTLKMAGGLMQLVAYGAQDVYLTGNPEVTFYQAKYKRHTNFAMENIEQTLNGNPADSGRVSVTIARNGDLVGDMYVELKTAASGVSGRSPFWAAERAITSVELSIGGQRVDKQYQKWWRLYSELYLDEAKKSVYGKMTSAGAASQVFLPLLFFFNRNPGLYLPLIALQYHEVRVDFDLSGTFETHLDKNVFKVWANYIYLDTEERRRFAQKGHEYLIEQTQHTGVDTVDGTNGGTKQIRLSYNHPVKELVWCLSGTPSRTTGTSVRVRAMVPPSPSSPSALRIPPPLSVRRTFPSPRLPARPSAPPVVRPRLPGPRSPRVRCPSSSSSSTARTASRARPASTSTRCSPSSTTPDAPSPAFTLIPSLSSPRNTSLRGPVIFRGSITRRSPSPPSAPPTPPTFTCSPPTTTSSASRAAWAASRSPTKALRSLGR